jgi:hypothetical protein
MGLIEQSTGNAMNGLVVLAGALVFAAVCSLALRHGNEERGARVAGSRQERTTL